MNNRSWERTAPCSQAQEACAAEMTRQRRQARLADPVTPYELDAAQIAVVLDALEVAAAARRERADQPCHGCATSAARTCDEHASDIDRASEYDTLADEIREEGR